LSSREVSARLRLSMPFGVGGEGRAAAEGQVRPFRGTPLPPDRKIFPLKKSSH
jgi:hypothetical protein